jgi:8-oxo-dGTP diphosphatase
MTSKHPVVGVGVVVLRDDDVLLIQRGKAPRLGEWSIPGGRQDWGETVGACAVREVLEETGLHVTLHGLLDVIDGLYSEEGELTAHYTLIDFWGTADGEPVAGDDAVAAQWVPYAQALERVSWGATRRVLEMARAIRDQQS